MNNEEELQDKHHNSQANLSKLPVPNVPEVSNKKASDTKAPAREQTDDEYIDAILAKYSILSRRNIPEAEVTRRRRILAEADQFVADFYKQTGETSDTSASNPPENS